jgi:hypothetical protein
VNVDRVDARQRHRAQPERVRGARVRRGGRSWDRPTRPRTCSASCCATSVRTTLLWAPTRSSMGAPQDQIQAFRAFQISPELQERFGYPALTDDIKRKGARAQRAAAVRRRPAHGAVPVHP